jgi:hypothetical protein
MGLNACSSFGDSWTGVHVKAMDGDDVTYVIRWNLLSTLVQNHRDDTADVLWGAWAAPAVVRAGSVPFTPTSPLQAGCGSLCAWYWSMCLPTSHTS